MAERDFAVTSSLLKQFCFECHADQHAEAKINLKRMTSGAPFATGFNTWKKVVDRLAQRKMPPQDARQPSDSQRRQLISKIREQLQIVAKQHAEDPGQVIMRRLTRAEYAYTLQDLTGFDLKLEHDFLSDAVGGEGFTNVGLVQFVQDSTLERYLEAAKKVAAHAVIGAGPLQFFRDPGKTGFELSAISRIQEIYRQHGFRTGAGEGGEAFGLDRYPRAFYTAWRFQHRQKLGLGNVTLAALAADEGLESRFAEYIWSVLTRRTSSSPTSEIVARWRLLPVPGGDHKQLATDVRAQCEGLYQLLHRWHNTLGQNADDKEQAFLLTADSFEVAQVKPFVMNLNNWPDGASQVIVHVFVEIVQGGGKQNPVVIWHKPAIQFRRKDLRLEVPRPLNMVLSRKSADRLAFGTHPKGGTVGRGDFVTTGAVSQTFDLPIPAGANSALLTVEAKLDVEYGDDCIVRCTISETKDALQGKTVSGLLANPDGSTFKAWVPGVLEFARLLPQVSHREPAPSDRDPIPPPFDNSYNNPERNDYHYKIKYHRDDQFLVDRILDDAMRERLDQAWTDLWASFEYHDAFLRFVIDKYKLDMAGRGIAERDLSWIETLPAEPRKYVRDLHRGYDSVHKALEAAQSGHVEDVIRFTSYAWRRTLTETEQARMRSYYEELRKRSQLGHPKAIRTLLARALVAPDFLFRTERSRPDGKTPDSPLSQWELASRLSYFLWSSLPDAQLRRAAQAGELDDPKQLARQARRMLRDRKSRRLAKEFFGQWFGFYQFDGYRGTDPQRFPQFTDSLKTAMHDEAVSFFEYIVRNDRPAREILFADYTFLNRELAEHYGIENAVSSTTIPQRVEGVLRFHRGGLFGLGAVLTVTSAPMRTSPVKRGDWILRRVLGTPVPPPPADAGSIPADDVLSDGLTVRQRLEDHRRDPSCANCHSRIDPLGFTLEHYDAIGRWRATYRDGQPIDASGKTNDGKVISGPRGLRDYLASHQELFQRTLSTKLLGYALGRRVSVSEEILIEQLMSEQQGDGRFSHLVERIVASKQFRYHRGNANWQPKTGIGGEKKQ